MPTRYGLEGTMQVQEEVLGGVRPRLTRTSMQKKLIGEKVEASRGQMIAWLSTEGVTATSILTQRIEKVTAHYLHLGKIAAEAVLERKVDGRWCVPLRNLVSVQIGKAQSDAFQHPFQALWVSRNWACTPQEVTETDMKMVVAHEGLEGVMIGDEAVNEAFSQADKFTRARLASLQHRLLNGVALRNEQETIDTASLLHIQASGF